MAAANAKPSTRTVRVQTCHTVGLPLYVIARWMQSPFNTYAVLRVILAAFDNRKPNSIDSFIYVSRCGLRSRFIYGAIAALSAPEQDEDYDPEDSTTWALKGCTGLDLLAVTRKAVNRYTPWHVRLKLTPAWKAACIATNGRWCKSTAYVNGVREKLFIANLDVRLIRKVWKTCGIAALHWHILLEADRSLRSSSNSQRHHKLPQDVYDLLMPVDTLAGQRRRQRAISALRDGGFSTSPDEPAVVDSQSTASCTQQVRL